MDILTLLAEARAAGLSVSLDSDTVNVSGPKSARPIVETLMGRKPELVEVLRNENRPKYGALWDNLRSGERRILDLRTGAVWSEFVSPN